MKIGILGSGDVAKALASGSLKHGHDLMLGTRTPAKLAKMERLQCEFGGARFAQAFNSVGNACMVNPQFKLLS